MKVLLINGSPRQNGCTDTALREMIGVFEANGVETELLWVGNKPVAGCIACGSCAKNGRCVYDDQVNGVLARLDTIDGIVVGSPVYYGGASAQVCCVLDRLCFCASPRLKGKLAAAVVSCRRGGASAAFDRLNKYFLMNNMTVVPSQYWNQVHGFTPDDVRKDEEGLQTMRTLGQNIAWLIEHTKGKKLPTYEPRVCTDFIR
jgi:multimeric flavodoxin WrbA